VNLEQFDPGTADKQLRACYDMAVANHPVDDPHVPPGSYGAFRTWWAFGWADEPIQTWLATDEAGAPAATYRLELPERENRRNAFGHIMVAAPYRRRGLGRLMLAHMADQAANAGRVLLMSDARVEGAGEAFAQATGGRAGLRDVRRRLDIDDELRGGLAGLRAGAEPRAVGYELRSWQGPVPEELVDGVCAVVTALGDAPHDDEFETATWDVTRLRASERRTLESGSRCHSVAALASATAEVAALTQVFVDPEVPDWGWQAITAVTRPHRGHRLGLLVKVAMLELLAELEPAIRHITTFNAERNDHMISVNEQLGYQVSDYFQSWNFDVGAAERLGSQP
jgi:GNAT superfamily N-acetyltransferase